MWSSAPTKISYNNAEFQRKMNKYASAFAIREDSFPIFVKNIKFSGKGAMWFAPASYEKRLK